MRILVTGASGFVGSTACVYLQSLGHEVIRFLGPTRALAAASFPVDVADLGTFPNPKLTFPLDAIIHCAGIAHRFGGVSMDDFDRVNVRGVENTIKFAEQSEVQKLVLLSSVLVYGTPRDPTPIGEDYPAAPDDDYGASKLKGEQVAIKMCQERSIQLTILRPAPIVGEGSRGNVARLIKAIDRRRFVWIGDGRNRRSFVYVGDVARAIEHVIRINDNVGPSVYNIVGGSISVADLVGSVERSLERRQSKLAIPSWAAKAIYHLSAVGSPIERIQRYRRLLATWLADAVYSGDRIERQLGFAAQTTIEEAIGREVGHYLRNK